MLGKNPPDSSDQFALSPKNTNLTPQAETHAVSYLHPAQQNPIQLNPLVLVQTPLQVLLTKYQTELLEIALIRAAKAGDLNALTMIFETRLIEEHNPILQTITLRFLLEKQGVLRMRKDDSHQDDSLDACKKQRKEFCDELQKSISNSAFNFYLTISELPYEIKQISDNIHKLMGKRKVQKGDIKYMVELIIVMKRISENIGLLINQCSQGLSLSINKEAFVKLEYKIEMLRKNTGNFWKLLIDKEIPNNKVSTLLNKIKEINQEIDQFRKEVIKFEESSDGLLDGSGTEMRKEKFTRRK